MLRALTHRISGSRTKLLALKNSGLYRALRPIDAFSARALRMGSRNYLNFSSNDYLGLATDAKVKAAAAKAARQWGGGSGSSRLIAGDLKLHEKLESMIARFKREEAALVYSSGYLANLGVITALLGERDVVIIDRLNHASLIDAARLSRAKLWVYPHRDMAALKHLLDRAGRFEKKMVVTDAYFSMDGSVAPLDQLVTLCREYGALLMIDEAHSTGVFGPDGRGLTERFQLSGQIDIVMGTLSKAIGSVGGFVSGSENLRELLINRSRSFIYTTAPAPAASGAALKALEIISSRASLRKKLWENIVFLRQRLAGMGLDLMGSEGPVIPVVIGQTQRALRWGQALQNQGLFVPVIRPPTVPSKGDRLRISVSAAHSKEDLERLSQALGTVIREVS